MLKFFKNEFVIVCFTLLASFVFRLFYLQKIPAELFGDVIEHMKFVSSMHKFGPNFTFFFGGDGPIFPHLAYIFTLLFGFKYATFKLVTSVFAVLTGLFVYLLGKKLFKNKATAFLAMFFCLTSFWSLSLGVAAKPHILAGLIAVMAVYLMSVNKKFLSGLMIGFGMFSQATFWGMAFYALTSFGSFFGFLTGSSYFWYVIYSNSKSMLSGTSYLGEKIAQNGQNFFVNVYHLALGMCINFFKNIKGIFIGGDMGFRHNVPGAAFLDPVTSIFVIFGILITLYKLICNKKSFSASQTKNIVLLLVLPFIFAQIAPMADVNNVENSPNIGRLFAISAPVFLIASYGLMQIKNLVAKISAHLAHILVIAFLIISACYNAYKFVVIYPKTLPNGNIAFGRVIGEYVNQNNIANPYIVDCCWGAWGQPEPYAVTFTRKNATFTPTVSSESLREQNICQTGMRELDTGVIQNVAKGQEYYFFSAPDLKLNMQKSVCMSLVSAKTISSDGVPVSKVYKFKVK